MIKQRKFDPTVPTRTGRQSRLVLVSRKARRTIRLASQWSETFRALISKLVLLKMFAALFAVSVTLAVSQSNGRTPLGVLNSACLALGDLFVPSRTPNGVFTVKLMPRFEMGCSSYPATILFLSQCVTPQRLMYSSRSLRT